MERSPVTLLSCWLLQDVRFTVIEIDHGYVTATASQAAWYGPEHMFLNQFQPVATPMNQP